MKALIVGIVGIFGLTACGGVDQAQKAASESQALSVELTSDLPSCNPSRESLVAYIKSEKTFYTCQNGNWEAITQPVVVTPPPVVPVPAIGKAAPVENAVVSPVVTPTSVPVETPVILPPPAFDLAAAQAKVVQARMNFFAYGKIYNGYGPCYSSKLNKLNDIWGAIGTYVPPEYLVASGCRTYLIYDDPNHPEMQMFVRADTMTETNYRTATDTERATWYRYDTTTQKVDNLPADFFGPQQH